MDDKCFFEWKFDCSQKSTPLTNAHSKRIGTIIRFSLETYKDGIHTNLQEQLDANPNMTIKCHKSCVSSYTSTHHAKRHKAKVGSDDTECPAPKKTRRSSMVSKTKFNFREHCLFCGEYCQLEKDPKNPGRWKPAFLCRQIFSKDGKELKKSILQKCDERADTLANEVRIRLEGALSDLPAADVRYHLECRNMFMSSRNVKAASTSSKSSTEDIDVTFDTIVDAMNKDQKRVWSSVDLHKLYQCNGGKDLSRKQLLAKIEMYFGTELLVLSCPGKANIVMFQAEAGNILKLVPDDEDDIGSAISMIGKRIIQEIKGIVNNKDSYNTRLDMETVEECISPSVLDLLSGISPKLNRTLPAFLIGNIITAMVTGNPTDLQIALGVLIRESKQLINQMYQFGVTCSYDEVLRFKKSAAVAAAGKMDLAGIVCADEDLVQIIVDNFDADISSQNGKMSTHSLAMLLAQKEQNTQEENRETIPRLKKDEMSKPIDYDYDIQRYTGSKKPVMPDKEAVKQVPTLKVLACIKVAEYRAKDLDEQFMFDMATLKNCPEYNGYNTKEARESGCALKPKTKAVYLPLIDMKPAEHDTIMTSMVEAKRLTEKTGQSYTVFTCDQQLYKIAVDIIWVHPEMFSDVYLRLGGMHMLMSFAGSVGTLMVNTGLTEVLEVTFGGVAKMLSGKKFPQNIRALRIVAEELIRNVILQHQLDKKSDLMEFLDRLSLTSKTSKLWVDVLIKPVFLMMLFTRAEREADWPLHLHTVRCMMPYFFAAGHFNYGRYGLYYLRKMEALPTEVRDHFMKGRHTVRHRVGIWNGIWSDQFIETTFMRYGKGQSGIIGVTLKPNTLKVWALSLHICSQLENDVANLSEMQINEQKYHKEEFSARITADQKDREAIRKKITTCIDPLNPDEHPPEIVNIVTGQIAPHSVNVHESVRIGEEEIKKFEESWPKGFLDALHKKVVTMAVMKKHIPIGSDKIFDTEVIYSRVMGLQASSRDVDLKSTFAHELAPVPTAMFKNSGEMRIMTDKAKLKKLLQVETSARNIHYDATVIDGAALLWIPNWPTKGSVSDFINGFKSLIEWKLKHGDVYLIFDKYLDFSTKSAARSGRASGASRIYILKADSELPQREVILNVAENKKQLIALICSDLITTFLDHNTIENKLVITGQDGIPVEIHRGIVISRNDIATSHEEADCIVTQQAIMLAQMDKCVKVEADDTDIFVMLLHFYHLMDLKAKIFMESPQRGRSVIDIQETVTKHKEYVHMILPAHALSGCDTVAQCQGIGKATALKVIRSGTYPNLLGDINANIDSVLPHATRFVLACYGKSNCGTLSEARLDAWAAKTGNCKTGTPKLSSLPPTNESFFENVKRAHLQAFIWKQALELTPKELNSESFGWVKDENSKTLQAVTVPEGVALAPEEILRLIKCSCESDTPCLSKRCGCNQARLSCTLFCACHGNVKCQNEMTRHSDENDDE